MSRRVPPRGFFDGESPFQRFPTEPGFPTFRLSRRVLWWIAGAAVVLLVIILLQPFAGLYTDWLWFRALGYGSVFGVRFAAQLWTFVIFTLIVWVVGTANVLIPLGSGRRLSTIGIRQRLLATPASIVSLIVVFLLGLIFGRIAASAWQTILAFLHQAPFGISDPVWHQDVAFYVFTLPFYRFLWGWSLGLTIVMAILAGALYAYRSGFQNLVLTTRAIRHLSVLAAAFAFLLALHYRLDLFELLLSARGFVYGVGYTDVAIRIPAYWIMVVLMLVITAGLLLNVVRPRLSPLPVGLAAWLGAAFILLAILPGIVQRVSVAPDELHKETPYIQHEIAATRQAFGLAGIEDRPFAPNQAVTGAEVAANPATVQNARLWDPQLALPETLQNQQGLRQYYDFSSIAVDRYTLDGQYLQLLLGPRELNTSASALPNAQSWVNLKLQYTHGYGVAAVRANQATPEGNPVLTLKDIPPSGVPPVTQPDIYFGRATNEYALVDTRQPEFDYPAEPDQYTHWTGSIGVRLTSGLRTLAFALRFGDVNILLSGDLTAQTQVLFHRQVQDRISTLAPFLQLDQDPYIAVVDGRIYWIQDAYTVSDHYPYSHVAPDDTQFAGENYARNSVKAVVDAYTGNTTLYVVDPTDPLVRTYGNIFPGLFQAFSAMPAGLQAHIRYPRDLFTAQAELFAQYHMTDPTVFYQKEDLWSIATENQQQSSTPVAMRPFYVIMRLPGETRAEFFTIQAYTPYNRYNMIAYLVARSDAPSYGKLLDYRFPKDSLIVGTQQVETNIDQQPAIKSQISLLNQSGSSVIRGNLLVLPIESSLLYVEPIYLTASNLQIPQLKKVIVATGQQVAMGDTLDQALSALLGAPQPTTAVTTPTGPVSGTVAQLIASANQHYQQAQADLQKGNFADYASEIQQVGVILKQLQAAESGAGASASPSPSPTASP
jgi:uncharacterized membrane protein (UPF0182 family)